MTQASSLQPADGIRSGVISCWCGVSRLWGGIHFTREGALEAVLTHQQEAGH